MARKLSSEDEKRFDAGQLPCDICQERFAVMCYEHADEYVCETCSGPVADASARQEFGTEVMEVLGRWEDLDEYPF